MFNKPKWVPFLLMLGPACQVLATEPVLKAEGYKTAIAVSMVVLFGTASTVLIPYTILCNN